MKTIRRKTQASPITWDLFQILVSRMAYDIDNKITNPKKKVQQSRFLLLIAIGCYTGLRISDILSLRWTDLLNEEKLDINEKKTGKHRSITLNENLRTLIQRYYEHINPVTRNDQILINLNGQVFSIQYVNKKLKMLFGEYKIKSKSVSSHTLRKTFALRVFEFNNRSEDSLITLSHIFNHSNVAVTRRYIGLEGEKIKNVYLGI